MLTVMTLVGALSYRGLYLPRDEIERLLSAPVARADIIRYRLFANLGRSIFFALVMSFLAAPRMRVFGFAFLGTFMATATLPLLGQATSLVCGGAENWLGRAAARVPASLLRVVAGIGAGILIVPLFFWGELVDSGAGWSLLENPSVTARKTAPGVPRSLAASSKSPIKMAVMERCKTAVPRMLCCSKLRRSNLRPTLNNKSSTP